MRGKHEDDLNGDDLYSKVLRTITTAGLLIIGAASAYAVPSYGDIAPPGVYFGSGNPSGNWTIDTANNLELALRAKNRSRDPAIDSSSGIYSVARGYCNPACSGSLKATWNYEFSIHALDHSSLSNYIFRLGVDHDPTAATNFSYVDPLTWWGDNATYLSEGAQNSQNVNFGNTPGGPFNVFTPGLYDFVLEAYAALESIAQQESPLASTRITVRVVPEPGSVALLGLGLLGLLAARKRKQQR